MGIHLPNKVVKYGGILQLGKGIGGGCFANFGYSCCQRLDFYLFYSVSI
jgi:hypothetical protein